MSNQGTNPHGSDKCVGAFPLLLLPRKRNAKFPKRSRIRVFSAFLVALTLISTVATALAATTIGTGSSTEYFQFVNNSGNWDGLGTPQHWDNANGNVAYCLQHQKDSPPASMTYSEFNPDTLMSSRVQAGLQAILEHGYPSSTGGFSADQARYATANAIRAWLSENGIGYNFMNPANGKIRAASGYQSLFNWMMELVGYARNGGTGGNAEISVSPLSQQWQQNGGGYTASIRVNLTGMNSYTLAPVSGVSVSGYTSSNGDYLTLTSPSGAAALLSFSGDSSGNNVSLYWYQPSGGSYQSVVVVDSSQGGVLTAYAQIARGEMGEETEPTPEGPDEPNPTPVPTPVPTPTPEPTYTLTIRKTDSQTGATLDGAQFELHRNGTVVDFRQNSAGQYEVGGSSTQFTTSGGVAVILGLYAGNYSIVEVSAPSGYATMSGSKQVSLSGNTSVDIENEPLVLLVLKTDSMTGKPVHGVVFELIGADDTHDIVTGVDGTATVSPIAEGTYTLREDRADGYALAPDQTITVTSANTSVSPATATVSNEPLALDLAKLDARTGESIAGAVFQASDGQSNAVKLSGMGEGVFRADASGSDRFTIPESGTARIYYLPEGNYTFREEEAPEGYALADPVDATITAANNRSNPTQVTVRDEPLALRVIKKDSLTNEPLAGVVFSLVRENGEVVRLRKGTDGSAFDGQYLVHKNDGSDDSIHGVGIADTFLTDEQGRATILYLPMGKYSIKEIGAPTGYALAKDTSMAINSTHGTSSPLETTILNEPIAFEIVKTDKLTGEPLPGAEFHLIDEDGEPLTFVQKEDERYHFDPEGDPAIITGEDGKAVLLYAPEGEYTLREVRPPKGYARTADEVIQLTTRHGFSAPLVFKLADDVVSLEIAKTDALTKKAMENVTFTLTLDGVPVKATQQDDGEWYTDASGADQLVTDAKGGIVLRYLVPGIYHLTETAPAGYAQPDPIEIVVTEAHTIGTPYRAAIANQPTELEVIKTDAYTGKPMGNLEFRLLDANGTAVLLEQQSGSNVWHPGKDNRSSTFKGDANGRAILRYLPIGSYTVEEVSSPAGYAKLPPQPVTIAKDNGTDNPVKSEIKNQPLRLIVEKLDALTNLPVRMLSIPKYSASTIVVSHSVGTTGVIGGGATSSTNAPGMPMSTTSTTSTAPTPTTSTNTTYRKEGVTADVVQFRLLGTDGKAIKLTEEGGHLVPNPNGKDIFGVNGHSRADILYLPAGEYTIEEITAPTGYAKEAAVKVRVQAENGMDKPVLTTIADKPLALEISKVRKDNGKGLSGAGFTLAVRGSDTPLTFTFRDGRYLYDPSGKETTIKVDAQGKAIIAYLPLGVYDLVETVVPFGFFAAPAQTVTIEDKHTIDTPASVTVENEAAVKLGFDSDRFRIPLAIALIFLATFGGTTFYLTYRARKRKIK